MKGLFCYAGILDSRLRGGEGKGEEENERKGKEKKIEKRKMDKFRNLVSKFLVMFYYLNNKKGWGGSRKKANPSILVYSKKRWDTWNETDFPLES
jgi:hypothetical protein